MGLVHAIRYRQLPPQQAAETLARLGGQVADVAGRGLYDKAGSKRLLGEIRRGIHSLEIRDQPGRDILESVKALSVNNERMVRGERVRNPGFGRYPEFGELGQIQADLAVLDVLEPVIYRERFLPRSAGRVIGTLGTREFAHIAGTAGVGLGTGLVVNASVNGQDTKDGIGAFWLGFGLLAQLFLTAPNMALAGQKTGIIAMIAGIGAHGVTASFAADRFLEIQQWPKGYIDSAALDEAVLGVVHIDGTDHDVVMHDRQGDFHSATDAQSFVSDDPASLGTLTGVVTQKTENTLRYHVVDLSIVDPGTGGVLPVPDSGAVRDMFPFWPGSDGNYHTADGGENWDGQEESSGVAYLDTPQDRLLLDSASLGGSTSTWLPTTETGEREPRIHDDM